MAPEDRISPFDYTGCLAHVDLIVREADYAVMKFAGLLHHHEPCRHVVLRRLPAVPLHPHVYEVALLQLSKLTHPLPSQVTLTILPAMYSERAKSRSPTSTPSSPASSIRPVVWSSPIGKRPRRTWLRSATDAPERDQAAPDLVVRGFVSPPTLVSNWTVFHMQVLSSSALPTDVNPPSYSLLFRLFDAAPPLTLARCECLNFAKRGGAYRHLRAAIAFLHIQHEHAPQQYPYAPVLPVSPAAAPRFKRAGFLHHQSTTRQHRSRRVTSPRPPSTRSGGDGGGGE